ncbi:MAG: lipid-A-disaccharide synthase [Cytophagales bacterium]|nr:MAG: lipid-A-disaccharide synthase [Cytophagales bacterium]TAF60261.1 MAG: lipid-A-disaccharide synthase [Cytophagales bacterium]
MKYYLIAGEKSGDMHGAALIRALHAQDSEAHVRAWGGEDCQDAGAELAFHYKNASFIGFWEVFKNLGTIRKHLQFCKADLLAYKPDVLILVDYPGFNLRMAEFAHQHGLRVVYYISPKIWAWNQGRVHKIKKYVQQIYCILPFEEAFYKQYGVEVHYVGNPLYDAIEQFQPKTDWRSGQQLDSKPLLALLPGSRVSELKYNLPDMIKAAQILAQKHGLETVVASLSHLSPELYKPATDCGMKLVMDDAYQLLAQAHVGIIASGTATLETALFKVPQVVVYKMNTLTALIAKLVIKVKYVSLVNLIANRELVKELLQFDFTTERLVKEIEPLLGGIEREKMLQDYEALRSQIQTEGVARRTAHLLIHWLRKP